MKRGWWSALVLLIMFGQESRGQIGASSRTLDDVVRETMRRNPRIKSQEFMVAAASASLKAERRRYYPALRFEAETGFQRDLNASIDAKDGFVGIVANQIIYDKRRFVEQDSRSFSLAAAQQRRLAVASEILYRVGLQFIEISRIQDEIEAYRKQEASVEEQRRAIKRRIDLGELKITSLFQVETKQNRIETLLARRHNDLSGARHRLQSICFCKLSESLQLPSFESWLKVLQTPDPVRPLTLQVESNAIQNAKFAVRKLIAEASPTLNLEGRLYQDPFDPDRHNRVSAALTLNWDLGVNDVNHLEKNSAKFELNERLLSFEYARQDYSLRLESAKQRFEKLLLQKELFEKASEQARMMKEAVDLEFREGEASLTDVLIAQEDLFSADLEMLRHRYELWTTYWELMYYKDLLLKRPDNE